MRFKLATANIGRNIGAAGVRADMTAIKKLGRVVVGWQEIDEGDPAEEHIILNDVFRRKFRNAGMSTRVPISVHGDFHIKREKVTLAAKGIPHASPVRVITEVMVVAKSRFWRKRLEPIVFINLHYPAGAFNNKREKNQEAREDRWRDTYKKHQERLEYWADKRGFTVFWTGDVNRMDMPKVHKDEKIIDSKGIDDIRVIERSTNVKVLRKGRLRSRSDHDAKYAVIKLSPKGNR